MIVSTGPRIAIAQATDKVSSTGARQLKQVMANGLGGIQCLMLPVQVPSERARLSLTTSGYANETVFLDLEASSTTQAAYVGGSVQLGLCFYEFQPISA